MPPEKNIQDSASDLPKDFDRMKAEKLSRYFLLIVLIVIAVLFFFMVKIFLIPVMMAAVFAGLFHPWYSYWLKMTRNKKGLSAFLCCLILILGLLIPTYIIANLVSKEAIGFYHSVEDGVGEIVQQGDQGLLGELKRQEWVRRLKLDKMDWESEIRDVATKIASILGTVINKASKGTFQLLTNLFLTFFAMYYFFKDGDQLIRRLKYLSPLPDKYEEDLIHRFISVSKATIKGTLLIGLIKGTLGGLTFWIFGIGAPILWGVVMVMLSIIPMIGAWLVMYPAAIIMILTGQVWQGIVLFLIAALIIGNIDNILGPRLVARGSGMHDLLVFFSTLGGISMFGVMGFILGPIIAALFLTILEVYSLEFRVQLEIAQGLGDKAPLEMQSFIINPNNAIKNKQDHQEIKDTKNQQDKIEK